MLLENSSYSEVGDAMKSILETGCESVENIRVRAARSTWARMKSFKLPLASEVWNMCKLIGLDEDSDLSPTGNDMVERMCADLKLSHNSGPFHPNPPELAVYSPLKRAKKTFEIGLLPLLPKISVECSNLLVERRVSEHVYAQQRFRNRVSAFERWIDAREEKSIIIVGHSQFFKHLLGSACPLSKFSNCDIWEYTRLGKGEDRFWKSKKQWYSSPLSEKYPPKSSEFVVKPVTSRSTYDGREITTGDAAGQSPEDLKHSRL